MAELKRMVGEGRRTNEGEREKKQKKKRKREKEKERKKKKKKGDEITKRRQETKRKKFDSSRSTWSHKRPDTHGYKQPVAGTDDGNRR